MFLALGLGFAAPFVLVAYAPGLLSRLPRPGPWMELFRKALAFPMYGAAAWLAWVLAQQAGPEDLAKLFAALQPADQLGMIYDSWALGGA